MSKEEADDLYADLYGEEAEPTVSAPKVEPAPAAAPSAAAPAPAPAAAPMADAAASFIPGRPAPPPIDSAEARSAAAARGEHIAPQDLPDEG